MTQSVPTSFVSDLLSCSASTAIKHMRAHGFEPVGRSGVSFLWKRADVDTVADERRRWQEQDGASHPAVAAWMDRDEHGAAEEAQDRDIVAERWGKPLDAAKLAEHRAAADRRKVGADAVVTRETIVALTNATNTGRLRSKSMRDAAEDERRYRAQHPRPARVFRLPQGSPQTWRASLYEVVVTDAFVKGTDALREKLLIDAGCRFRLSPRLTSWAKNEYYARLRREVFADGEA